MKQQCDYEVVAEVPVVTGGQESLSTYSETASVTETNSQMCLHTCSNIFWKVFEFQLNSQNENIVAFFWAMVVLFIGVIFTVAQYTKTSVQDYFPTTYWMLFALMFISIIGLAILIANQNNKNCIETVCDGDSDDYENKGIIKSKYLIVNAYIFAVGNFLLDLFSILTVFHCGIGTNDHVIYISKFAFHFTRIIFTSLQLIFLQIFTSSKVKKRSRLFFKVLIVHVIATNFLIWFTYLCQETGILKGDSNGATGEYSHNCSSTPDDNVYKTAKDMNETLHPFVLEFSLLAATLLLSVCPLKILPSKMMKYNSRAVRKYYGATDHARRDDSETFKYDLGLLVGIFIALLLILSSWNLKDESHYLYNLRFSYSMQIIVHILIIISCAVTLVNLKTNHSKAANKSRKYQIDDILLLITGPGGALPFLFTLLFSLTYNFEKPDGMSDLVAETLSKHEQEIKGLLGFMTILNIASVLMQTFFLVEAHSYDRIPVSSKQHNSTYNEQDEDAHSYPLCSAAIISQWLLFLMVLNVAIWIISSFFEMRGDLGQTYGIAVAYWNPKTWGFISKLLYPIIIFYRFHSVAMISHIWFHFQVKKKLI